jgi:hypothetical protein
MGMFDTVVVRCPSCGDPAYFQSKAGDCVLASLSLDNASPDVLADLAGDQHTCDCGETFRIVVQINAWVESVNGPGRHGRIIGRE